MDTITIVKITVTKTREIIWNVPQLEDAFSRKKDAVAALRRAGFTGKIIVDSDNV